MTTQPDPVREAAIKHYASGATILEVAQCLRVGERKVSRWVHEAGILRPPGPSGQRVIRPSLPNVAYEGDWVRVGLILRPVARKVEPVIEEPEPEATIHALPVSIDAIACPTCHATMAQHCRSKSGRKLKAAAHPSRLTPRTCGCGAKLEPRRQLCAPCRAESDRRRSRESKQRSRDAA